MKSILVTCLQGLLLLIAVNAYAEAGTELKPGDYIFDQDAGVLSLQRKSNGQLHFTINTIGSNCHTCELSGKIQGTQAIALTDENKPCRFTIKAQGTMLEVDNLSGECRYFCGARGYFEGRYYSSPPHCTAKARRATRERFFKLYKAHSYGPAQKILEDLLAQCPQFMDFIEQDKIRNDLALAQYHDGHPEACLKTLAKTIVGESAEGEIPLAPCDSDNYAETAKAVWFNQKLCRKPKKGSR